MSDAFILSGASVYERHGGNPVGAVGVSDGVVVALGSLDDVRRGMPTDTLIDVVQGTVLPAFVDAHQHAFLVAADPFVDVLHGGASTIAELLDTVRSLVVASQFSKGWLRFHGYSTLSLDEMRSPTAVELDSVCADRPLHVMGRTFHESVVNTAGLEALGIARSTPDPPGGRIVRDRGGTPTGVLLEAASFSAERASRPSFDAQGLTQRLRAHGRLLASHGITRIGDAAVPCDAVDLLVKALRDVGIAAHPLVIGSGIDEPAFESGLTSKVLVDGGEYCELCMTSRQLGIVLAASARAQFGAERRAARAVGERSGRPRRGANGLWRTGIRLTSDERLRAYVHVAAESGSGLALHAVGNGAVDAVVAITPLAAGAGVPLRVEHAMTLDGALSAAIATAAIPVVAQPGFIAAFGHELNLVPVPRPMKLMPFATMLRDGIQLVFSSDFPAAELNPWIAIAAAVNRRDRMGLSVHEEESISVSEALRAHSESGAAVLGVPEAGQLTVGAPADMVLVDRDPYLVPTDELAMTRTMATWSRGIRIFG